MTPSHTIKNTTALVDEIIERFIPDYQEWLK
jgi:hypothetical protein